MVLFYRSIFVLGLCAYIAHTAHTNEGRVPRTKLLRSHVSGCSIFRAPRAKSSYEGTTIRRHPYKASVSVVLPLLSKLTNPHYA